MFYKKYYNKLNLWLIEWAYTPYSIIALFIISFSEAIIFPLPPDILLITLVFLQKQHILKYTLFCTIGSIMGALFGYYIGYNMWWNGNEYSSLALFFFDNIPSFTSNNFETLQYYYEEYGFMIIFSAGFTPIPFKIFTISSGAMNIPIELFLIAASISRFSRFLIVSLIIYFYGNNISVIIKKYFNKASLLFVILLFAVYYIIKSII